MTESASGILEAAGGDDELARDLATTFLDELVRIGADVRAASAKGDPVSVGDAAHELKGCASILGFTQLAEAARLLEADARNATLAPSLVTEHLNRIASASEEADRAARAFLRT